MFKTRFLTVVSGGRVLAGAVLAEVLRDGVQARLLVLLRLLLVGRAGGVAAAGAWERERGKTSWEAGLLSHFNNTPLLRLWVY